MTLPQFLTLVEAYGKATGLAEATISTRVLHDGKRINELRSGRDIGVRRLDEAHQWFAANWPAEASWPSGVPHPTEAAAS